jgi:stage V sporulation protein G
MGADFLAPASRGTIMEITEVKVFPVDEEKLKAYITIVLDNCFVVRDLKIISGTTGLFVAMPSKRRKDGSFKDIAHPLNQSTREVMEKTILDAYLAEIKNPGARQPQTATHAENAD